jgi:hypothetical protein
LAFYKHECKNSTLYIFNQVSVFKQDRIIYFRNSCFNHLNVGEIKTISEYKKVFEINGQHVHVTDGMDGYLRFTWGKFKYSIKYKWSLASKGSYDERVLIHFLTQWYDCKFATGPTERGKLTDNSRLMCTVHEDGHDMYFLQDSRDIDNPFCVVNLSNLEVRDLVVNREGSTILARIKCCINGAVLKMDEDSIIYAGVVLDLIHRSSKREIYPAFRFIKLYLVRAYINCILGRGVEDSIMGFTCYPYNRVDPGKMFPTLKLNSVNFASHLEKALVFKLPTLCPVSVCVKKENPDRSIVKMFNRDDHLEICVVAIPKFKHYDDIIIICD